ncbi:FK506-binding protein 15-like isoform X1 [Diorhabda sublineata]|uniref:FK506-binding protein 15-like isoform X1 n=2 Tax=Diorhabda sublineata TaxID=1163346 RepID=UPI0024E0A1A7|nr:FK506-binding protein 15-like isoform X1 [Diorhabda sublineata]
MFENDDDYDFNPLDSSKLSSLFESPPSQNEDTSKNLIYTAPKQPTVSKNTSTTVITIKIVILWKSEDKTYKPMGKHGIAIIGSTDLKTYEVIAYKHKTNTVLRAKINEQFYFQQRKDNFSSFYDNNKQNWLVRFDNNEQQIEFSEHLKLCGGIVILEDNKPKISPKPATQDLDSDSSDSIKKTNILNRITKMGQQIVPKPLEVIESDISDEYESNKNKKFRRIKKIDREEETNIVPICYSSYNDLNSILISHNSEIKTSLNQIVEKLDTISVQKKECSSSLSSRLKVLELKSENLQAELKRYKQKCSDLEKKTSADVLEKSLEESKLHEQTVETLKQSVEDLKNEYAKIEQENVDLKEKIEEYEKIEAERRKKVQENEENVRILCRLVKEEMNEMYQSVLNEFDIEESYTLNQIQNVLIKGLKDASYRIINDIKEKIGDVKDD